MIHFNAKKLALLIEQTGLTQRHISQLTGFSTPYLSLLLSEQVPFTDNVQNKLNQAFDTIVHSSEAYTQAVRDLEITFKGLSDNG